MLPARPRTGHQAGGLFILGTERHESRRIDNQLRGRAGRQGDPGASRFYLSLEDDLMRIFAKQWVSTLLERLGMEEGVPIESRMISKRIEGAQKAVEAQNFESRKHLLEYDDVMNKQREAVYGLRRQLLESVEQRELILEDYVGGILSGLLDEFAPKTSAPINGTSRDSKTKLIDHFGLEPRRRRASRRALTVTNSAMTIFESSSEVRSKEKILGAETMRYHERMVMLSVIDGLWKDHLLSMDHLKEGIGLRGYAQQDPLVAYKTRVLRHVRSHDAEVPGRHGALPLPHADSSAPTASPSTPLPSRAAPFLRLLRLKVLHSPLMATARRAPREIAFPRAPAVHHHRRPRKGVPPQEAA